MSTIKPATEPTSEQPAAGAAKRSGEPSTPASPGSQFSRRQLITGYMLSLSDCSVNKQRNIQIEPRDLKQSLDWCSGIQYRLNWSTASIRFKSCHYTWWRNEVSMLDFSEFKRDHPGNGSAIRKWALAARLGGDFAELGFIRDLPRTPARHRNTATERRMFSVSEKKARGERELRKEVSRRVNTRREQSRSPPRLGTRFDGGESRDEAASEARRGRTVEANRGDADGEKNTGDTEGPGWKG
ncbi:hypothetical protein C8R45DRAFT_918099 [Mycena sanguinolenta]|nr:hypothetical protein C8R45DRAFT_918099 [Mycena sanguinolenta]